MTISPSLAWTLSPTAMENSLPFEVAPEPMMIVGMSELLLKAAEIHLS
jgi:hypothetical protein